MKYFLWIASGFLILALFTQWIRLPLAFEGVWMSPDETANAITAINWVKTGDFKLANPLVTSYEWAFPRSFTPLISQGQMVPVGFLGMIITIGAVYTLFGLYGLLFFTPFFALLTLWAGWRCLPKVWSPETKFMTLLIWMSFPTVVLYANRGLFPNLVVICLAIWLWFLLTQYKGWWAYLLSGAVLGWGLMIRPTEALWLVPVAFSAWLYSRDEKTSTENKLETKLLWWFALGWLILAGLGAVAGRQTYDQWLVAGYQIRSAVQVQATGADSLTEQAVPAWEILPFSIHPRNIEWNVRHYIFGYLWPWALVALLALVFMWRARAWKGRGKWPLLAMMVTAMAVIGFYGNGLYHDHVLTNHPSLGNSFLRYILPLSVLFAFCAGYVINVLQRHWSTKILAICLTAALVSFGLWSAISRDNEGLAANEAELKRYADVRDLAKAHLREGTVVVSDRSDKIFFPAFMAVSPIPEPDSISFMLWNDVPVALFTTTQNEQGLAKWALLGLRLDHLFTDGNESLYDIQIIED